MSEGTATGDLDWLPGGRRRADRRTVDLLVAWCPAAPARAGERVVLEGEDLVSLGRGPTGERAPRARLVRARPGGALPCPPLDAREISQDACLVAREGSRITVRRGGRAALLQRGDEREEVTLGPGEVVVVDGQIVLLAAERGAPLLESAGMPGFAFGEADPGGLVGESAVAWELRDRAAFAGARPGHVLVTGPSGAGKELVARLVHGASPRRGGPLVARNTATLPSTLIDAELFGNARNYPNAGMPERPGLVGEAHGGTLVLDEIGELPIEGQAHLLRFLDGGEYQRLGEARTRRADVVVVALTNRPEALKEDLAARFTHRIDVPPLGDRIEDVPLLLRWWLRQRALASPPLATRFFQDGEPRVAPELVEALLLHRWETHVRELAQLLTLAEQESTSRFLELTPGVQRRLRFPEREEPREPPSEAAIRAALEGAGGSVSRAAEALGLRNRNVLYRLMKKYGVEP